jgi:hypothetical protein
VSFGHNRVHYINIIVITGGLRASKTRNTLICPTHYIYSNTVPTPSLLSVPSSRTKNDKISYQFHTIRRFVLKCRTYGNEIVSNSSSTKNKNYPSSSSRILSCWVGSSFYSVSNGLLILLLCHSVYVAPKSGTHPVGTLRASIATKTIYNRSWSHRHFQSSAALHLGGMLRQEREAFTQSNVVNIPDEAQVTLDSDDGMTVLLFQIDNLCTLFSREKIVRLTGCSRRSWKTDAFAVTTRTAQLSPDEQTYTVCTSSTIILSRGLCTLLFPMGKKEDEKCER